MMPVASGVEIPDLEWSDPRKVPTSRGPRIVRSAPSTPAFREVWMEHKEALKAAGYSLSQWQGEWQVSLWSELSEEEIAETNAAVEASQATDSDIYIPVNDGLAYLPYQRGGIAYGASRKAVLIGDEMGLGKTIQAIGIANVTGASKILVLCPASLKFNWRNELAKWLTIPHGCLVIDGKTPATVVRSAITSDEPTVCVINYDITHKFESELRAIEWDLLIGDEVHYLKNDKARRTKHVIGYEPKGKAAEKADPIDPIPAARRVFLTGTPIVNRPIEIFSIVNFLAPDVFPNRFKFGKKYCDAHHNGHGWDFSGASNLDELQRELRSSIMVRRLKKDVLKDLPNKTRQTIVIEPTTAEMKRALANEARVCAELAKAADELESVTYPFEQLSEARHLTALSKCDVVVEHVLDAADSARKVVVFAHHKDVVKRISEAVTDAGIRTVMVTGDMNAESRQASVETFQGDEEPMVFIGTIGAAGVGLTLTKSAHVIFAELDWVPGNLSQAEDRCHRIGQDNAVLVQHIVLDQSLDARIAQTVVEKQRVLDAALDDAVKELTREELDQTAADWRELIEKENADTPDADTIAKLQGFARVLAASDDDHAAFQNGVGYNGADTDFGHKLAGAGHWTPRMARAGYKMLRKYKRQIGEEAWAEVYGGES